MSSNPNRPRTQAPYKQQDTFAYIRVQKGQGKNNLVCAPASWGGYRNELCAMYYDDTKPMTRIISARRVEQAVEDADYMQKCMDEGFSAFTFASSDDGGQIWQVCAHKPKWDSGIATDRSLRAAYHRCKSVAVPAE